MKVGDYVRTIKGIGKIEKIETDKQDTIVYLDSGITIDYITKDFTEEEINKMYPSSSRIIELIEVGDYVNGHTVKMIKEDKSKIDIGEGEDYFWLRNQDILSIVTKEQFENCMYEVGDKE